MKSWERNIRGVWEVKSVPSRAFEKVYRRQHPKISSTPQDNTQKRKQQKGWYGFPPAGSNMAMENPSFTDDTIFPTKPLNCIICKWWIFHCHFPNQIFELSLEISQPATVDSTIWGPWFSSKALVDSCDDDAWLLCLTQREAVDVGSWKMPWKMALVYNTYLYNIYIYISWQIRIFHSPELI